MGIVKEGTSNALLGLVAVAVLVSSANLIVSTRPPGAEIVPAQQVQESAAPAPTPAPVPAKARALKTRAVDLQYPDGWHVSVVEDAEAAGGPSTEIRLNDGPLTASYPSDVAGVAKVKIQTIAADAAIYAGYEEADWKSFKSNEVTVNGQRATQFLAEAGPDMELSPAFEEVLFISGPTKRIEVHYEYSEMSEANDPAWLQIKNSLKVK